MASYILPATFGERLLEALENQGITDFNQQVEKVSLICEVTPRTAKKYLQAAKCPLQLTTLAKLSNALKCGFEWLYWGRGLPLVITRAMATMTAEEKEKYVQYTKMLRDEIPGAVELGGKLSSGKISRQEFFAAI